MPGLHKKAQWRVSCNHLEFHITILQNYEGENKAIA